MKVQMGFRWGSKMALDENGETGTPAYLELMDVIESQLEA